MNAAVLRGDARQLPLPDASVDLIVTSPPYFSLRSYTDGGEHYDGQIGSEATPAQWLASLLDATREWMRVLKPTGSMFVNLGDKYSQRVASRPSSHQDGLFPGRPELRKDWKRDRAAGRARMPYQNVINDAGNHVREKSLMGLPWRYALACMDDLGLILRRDVIWAKLNGLPESVTDRCRCSHEYVFHLVKQPRYYAAMDEIREPHAPWTIKAYAYEQASHYNRRKNPDRVDEGDARDYAVANPLGKIPGSVWSIATQPLTVPAELAIEHYAAFPMELPRRIILGWSPPGICTACGEGRRPVTTYTGDQGRHPGGGTTYRAMRPGGEKDTNLADGALRARVITGYACACTPHTDHPERRKPTVTPGQALGRGHQANDLRAAAIGTRHHGDDWPTRQPVRDWHFDQWTPPPARPAVVLDPFAGTGTTMLVASVLGRHGIGVDRSADYCRLAAWRVRDPGQRARAAGLPKPPPAPAANQASLFDTEGAA